MERWEREQQLKAAEARMGAVNTYMGGALGGSLMQAPDPEEERRYRARMELRQAFDVSMAVVHAMGTPEDFLELTNAAQNKAAEILQRSRPVGGDGK